MLTRQKIVLDLISRANGRIGKLDFVKLMFLLGLESNAVRDTGTFYQFLPYHYGPFSFTLYSEMNALQRSGEIKATETEYELTNKGKSVVPNIEPDLTQEVDTVMDQYGKLPTHKLVEYVYESHPWFTVKSLQAARRKRTLPQADPGVYTAGYEGMQVDGFLNLLLKAGIKTVIDVRANPISRKYGFHKSTLSRLCQNVDIDYRHYPQVGIPPSWRQELTTDEEYRRLFDRYENEILPRESKTIAEIAGVMAQGPAVLVCREKNPGYCHRQRLSKVVGRKTGLEINDMRYAT